MSLRPLSILSIASCLGQNRRRSWDDLRLFADQPWFKRLSPQDILKKIDTKSITGSHYKPHEWTLKTFQSSCLLFECSRARHMMRCCHGSFSWTNSGQDWCSNVGVLQDKGGPAAVNAIKALALNGQHTFFINAAVMLWKSNAISSRTGGAVGVEGAIASSGLPATLLGCAGWWRSLTLHASSCRSQDKKDRWLCPCHLPVYNGCFSPKVVMSRFAFEQIPKPGYLLYIVDSTTELYRDYIYTYRKPV